MMRESILNLGMSSRRFGFRKSLGRKYEGRREPTLFRGGPRCIIADMCFLEIGIRRG